MSLVLTEESVLEIHFFLRLAAKFPRLQSLPPPSKKKYFSKKQTNDLAQPKRNIS